MTRFLKQHLSLFALVPVVLALGLAVWVPVPFLPGWAVGLGVLFVGIVGVLTRHLIVRGQKLAASNAALEETRLDLERRVRLRTLELAEANKLLQQEMYERKQAEQELVRFERLRALSELSAGISHNLNNLLTGILGPIELLEMNTQDPKLRAYSDMIKRSAKRAADLVARLHQAVKVESKHLGPVLVPDAIEKAVSVTRPRWKDEAEANGVGIEVVTDCEGVPPIRGTLSELQEILINLIFNAVDAMPRGGRLTIRARKRNDQVMVTVSDTGVGMAEAVRRRVFEPFFTTKMDVGSGLGLATVHGTVRRWGAVVDVASEPGRGTTFTLGLPIWTEAIEAPAPPVEPPTSTAQKRVLVVDDEDVVVGIIASVLGPEHEILTALSGPEALDVFVRQGCDVALIDLGMPGMPGDQVAKAMKQQDPRVVTMMVSGWKLNEDDPRLSEFDDVVYKPFEKLDVLRQAVRRAAALHNARVEEAEQKGPLQLPEA